MLVQSQRFEDATSPAHHLDIILSKLEVKEFCAVLQMVHFVIYDHVTEEVQHLWTVLCMLGLCVCTVASDLNQQKDQYSIVIYVKEGNQAYLK